MRTILLLASLMGASLTAAAANTFSTDASDMWWNPAESGWGLNVVEELNVIFATLYVYAPDGSAHWYVAPDMESNGATPVTFTGDLYETTGPTFTASFDPNAVTRRVVGTATFTYSSTNSAAFSYTVNGNAVSKGLQRMTWRTPDVTGEYDVWRNTRSNNCSGTVPITSRRYVIQESGNALTIQSYQGTDLQCSWSGTISQAGRMSTITATGSCAATPSAPSSLRIDDLEVGANGFLGHITVTEDGCDLFGRIAGVNTLAPSF